MTETISKIRYFGRCARELAVYGRKSEYVARYGYVQTIKDIARIQVRSHWLRA